MEALELLVEVEPLSTRYDPIDDRWARQADDLYRDLVADVPGARRVHTAEPGAKGSVESIVIALGSAGVITALTQCFQLWLKRDRTRRLRVTWTGDGEPQSLTIEGDGVTEEALNRLAEALAKHLES